ncbi:MAG: hypothetical protein R3E21_00605 [Caenibius sp.]
MGHPRLMDEGGARVEMTSKKAIAVLGLLALASDGIRSRAWLQQKLWGSRDTKQAQNSLRRELSNMRKDLPCVPLIADHRAVRLDLERIWIDTRNGTGSEMPPGEEFLEGLDIAGEEDFEEWLRDARSQIAAEFQELVGLLDDDEPDDKSARPKAGGTVGERAAGNAANGASGQVEGQQAWHDARPRIILLPANAFMAGGEDSALLRGLVTQQLGQVLSRMGTVDVLALQPDVSGSPTDASAQDQADFQIGLDIMSLGDAPLVAVNCIDRGTGILVWSDTAPLPPKLQHSELQLRVGRLANSIEGAILGEMRRRAEPVEAAQDGVERMARIRTVQRAALRRTFTTTEMALTEQIQQEAISAPDLPEDALFRAQIALRRFWWGASQLSLQAVRQIGEKAMANFPGDARPLVILGVVERWSGNFPAAMHLLERALVANPASAPAYANLGVLALLDGNLPRAMQMLRTAEAISPFDPEQAWTNAQLAVTCLVSGEHDEALRHAGNALALQSRHALPALVALSCHIAKGHAAAARRMARHPALVRRGVVDHALTLMPFTNPAHLAVLRQGLDQVTRA